jgi:diphosphomevalonate decarboxylase
VRLEKKYKEAALKLRNPGSENGLVAWRSPSNIALIKYWGKRDFQLPQNPSLSFVLDKSFTETSLEYGYRGNMGNKGNRGDKGNREIDGNRGENGIRVEFKFENQTNPAFEARIETFLNTVSEFMPFLHQFDMKIESRNSFPHSSGIASSASSMSALALCLVSIEKQLFGTPDDDDSFYQKASFLARLGSGSASRSVYNDFVVWGKHASISGSSDEIAIKLNQPVAPVFQKLRDAVLITSSAKKKISSGQGHQMMQDHPFANQRYAQAKNNLTLLAEALRTGDEPAFIQIVENEALSLHAMMMTSVPGYTLLNDNSWNIIERIRQFRSEQNVFITFTLDAGPNVHLLYAERNKDQVIRFIQKDLLQFCERNNWIDDHAGDGPVKLK